MDRSLADLVRLWCDAVGITPNLWPSPAQLNQSFDLTQPSCRAGVDSASLRSWERRFGYPLPDGLKQWLLLSNGFYAGEGPLIHPLSAIGPMVPFAAIPGLALQPESWFELGNPNRETVCIDLGYRWPNGDYPLFSSGDDETKTPPHLIAPGFNGWFLQILQQGGAEFWLDPSFVSLGDPWEEHRRWVPSPPLPESLRPHLSQVHSLLREGTDDGLIAQTLQLSRGDIETIVRHIQHGPVNVFAVGAEARS